MHFKKYKIPREITKGSKQPEDERENESRQRERQYWLSVGVAGNKYFDKSGFSVLDKLQLVPVRANILSLAVGSRCDARENCNIVCNVKFPLRYTQVSLWLGLMGLSHQFKSC
jgi:hypothetical protein